MLQKFTLMFQVGIFLVSRDEKGWCIEYFMRCIKITPSVQIENLFSINKNRGEEKLHQAFEPMD